MSNLICTAHEGRSWIVSYVVKSIAVGYDATDHWEVFESLADAKQSFDELHRLASTDYISISAVMHSSDYETHPAFEEAQ